VADGRLLREVRVTRLPRSLADIRGLRAARWSRESTTGQWDNFGPDAQREQQDRAIERHELVDTGIAWTVAHSGRTVATTNQFADMLARAGRDYDVLLVGYNSRFTRNLKHALVAIEDRLHPAGAAVLFCDERVLSSDPDQWEHWTREAHEAEAHSRRLGRRIREGYEAKFRRLADQGGNAPLGFRRSGDRHVLEIDPDAILTVRAAYAVYADGDTSLRQIEAETGIAEGALREMLRNPIYNGWSLRRGERVPAPWRLDPPIDDELWGRVQLVRERRVTGGGGARPVHGHLLCKRVWCVCGDRIKADGARRYRHARRCPAWERGSYSRPVYEAPIRAQLASAKLKPEHVASLRRLAGRSIAPPTGELRRKQLERQLVDRAAGHARREIGTEEYLAAFGRISAEIDALADRPPVAPLVDADVAVARVNEFREAWQWADESDRRELVAAIYSRVVVRGAEIVEADLTADAWRHGFAFALPERVALARPAGFEPATWWSEATRSIH
jgi:DNA invertase Pin-like site-specific DNA recombinase